MLSPPYLPRPSPSATPIRTAGPWTPSPLSPLSAASTTSFTTYSNDMSRPRAKRQLTTPEVVSADLVKKMRIFDRVDETDGSGEWNKEMEEALLEAMKFYPAAPSWISQTGLLFEEHASETDSENCAAFLNNICDLIFRKTGKVCDVDHIQRRCSESYRKNFTNDKLLDLCDNQHTSPAFLPECSSLGFSPYSSLHHDGDQRISETQDSSMASPPSSLNNEALSLSERRRASNRPTLELKVNLPAPSMNFPVVRRHSQISSRPATPISHSIISSPVNQTFTSWLPSGIHTNGNNSNPMTPVDQIGKNPLVPPPVPRLFDTKRNTFGYRWLPTPTEGVFPTVSYATGTAASPVQNPLIDTENLETTSGNEHMGSLGRLSWLTHQAMARGTPTTTRSQYLASPLTIVPLQNPFVLQEWGINSEATPTVPANTIMEDN